MSREEAIESLRGILTEAVEFKNSVCYVTEEDREPLEMAIKALEQEPCEDAISRQAVLDITWEEPSYTDPLNVLTEVRDKVKDLPPVNPQPKTGHWIHFAASDDCSECGWSTGKYISPSKYCPNCGCRMVEPQESEDK